MLTVLLSPEKRHLIDLILHPDTPPPARFRAGHRLSRLGDPRPGVGLDKNGVPDVQWVEIPGGEFIFQDGLVYATLPTFYMARYPITVMQYAAFVACGGYENRAYWTRDGWKWREGRSAPMLWQTPKWHIPNHPVVGVSWYEAAAFCCWLAVQLGCDGDMIRLPAEMEWEKAARGTDGRMYPWGSERRTGGANINETYASHYVGEHFLKRTTAVGIYPADSSPYGVMDLCGNVREWCLTRYHDIGRVVRGAAWFNNSLQAQLTHRNWFYEYNADHGIGFRPMAVLYPGRQFGWN